MPVEWGRAKTIKDLICLYKLFGLILSTFGRNFRILSRGMM